MPARVATTVRSVARHPVPAHLDRALRYLNDAELDRLQQAVSAEARRRGRLPAEGNPPESGREDKNTPGAQRGSRQHRNASRSRSHPDRRG